MKESPGTIPVHTTPGAISPDRPALDAVCGVMVCYRPVLERLSPALAAALGQLDAIVVVDNSPEPGDQAAVRAAVAAATRSGGGRGAELLTLGENRGLSIGLNAGLREARRLGFNVFLLLDQDSLLAPEALLALKDEYRRCGGMSSATLLAAQNDLPAPSRGHLLLERYLYGYTSGPAPSRSGRLALTSGLLLNARALDRVGGFDESMFVDSVDHEFCCRARSAGVPLRTVPMARIRHHLGEPGSVPGDFLGLPLRYRDENRLFCGTRDTLRTVRRHGQFDPVLGATLGAVTMLRILAYWAAGPSGERQYRAARRALREFLQQADHPQIPRI